MRISQQEIDQGKHNTCLRKQVYETRYLATRRADTWQLFPYKCPYCGKYHTSKSNRDPNNQGIVYRTAFRRQAIKQKAIYESGGAKVKLIRLGNDYLITTRDEGI